MDIKSAVKDMWLEIFDNESRDWTQMYFDKVYSETNNHIKLCDTTIASSLMLEPYKMNFLNTEIGLGYIMGAMTRSDFRNQGLMNALMKETLISVKDQYPLIALIPANRELFGFYGKMGFATVFYNDVQHYTSIHKFHNSGRNIINTSFSINELFEFYHKIELNIPNRVLHSHDNFENLIWDNNLDGGKIFVVSNDNKITGIAFVVPNPNRSDIIVRDILVVDEEAELDLLNAIKEFYFDKDMVVEAMVSHVCHVPKEKGMIRIANVKKLLELIAQNDLDRQVTIKISDELIPGNSGIYNINQGQVTYTSKYYNFSERIDDDVDIRTLAEILFNTPANGELFKLPAHRASMTLMLD